MTLPLCRFVLAFTWLYQGLGHRVDKAGASCERAVWMACTGGALALSVIALVEI